MKDKEMRKLVTLMLKQILRSDQQAAALQGALFDTIICDAEGAEVQEALAQNAHYAKATDHKPGHGLGPPHIYTFTGILAGLIKRKDELEPADAERLQELHLKLEPLTVPQTCELVQYCRVDKVYDESKRRITLCIERTQARPQFLAALEKLGGDRRFGRAPRTHMARELQMWLEALLTAQGK